jgi:hypothetical protein
MTLLVAIITAGSERSNLVAAATCYGPTILYGSADLISPMPPLLQSVPTIRYQNYRAVSIYTVAATRIIKWLIHFNIIFGITRG